MNAGSSEMMGTQSVVESSRRLIHARASLDGLKGDNDDQNVGISIARRAMEEPLRQIVGNAGDEGSVL